jgi:hypothetical protein
MKLTNQHKTVTQGEWGVSVATGDGIDGARLSVYRFRVHGVELSGRCLRGFGYGRLFATQSEAWQWAFDHGYLQLYFTEASLRARRKKSAHVPRCPYCCNPVTEHASECR